MQSKSIDVIYVIINFTWQKKPETESFSTLGESMCPFFPSNNTPVKVGGVSLEDGAETSDWHK